MGKGTVSIGQEPRVPQGNAPWKNVGHPGLSRFMASSTDCFSIRAFSHLNVHVLLKLQNDIVKLEGELMGMDVHMPNDSKCSFQGGCGSFRLDEDSPRGKLLDCIGEKLKDYNERLNQFLRLQDRPKSSSQQVRNLRLWLENHSDAIEKEEREFLEHDEDLLAVRTARRSRFSRWMQSLGVSCAASTSGLTSKDATLYYDRGVWKSIGAFGVLFMLIVMLIGPIWALPFAAGSLERLSVITGFVLAFSLLIIIGTTLSSFQRMIIIAGYSTELVIAVGLIPLWEQNTTNAIPDTSEPTSTPPNIITATVATVTASLSTSTLTSMSTTPSSEHSNFAKDQSGAAMTPAAIAGVGASIFVAVPLTLTLMFVCLRRRRRKDPCSQGDFQDESAETDRRKSDGESCIGGFTTKIGTPRNEPDGEPCNGKCTPGTRMPPPYELAGMSPPHELAVTSPPHELNGEFRDLERVELAGHSTLQRPGAVARHDTTGNRESAFVRLNTSSARQDQYPELDLRTATVSRLIFSVSEQGSAVSLSNSKRRSQQHVRAAQSTDDEDDCEVDDEKI